MNIIPLSWLSPGEEGIIVDIRGGRGWRKRLMEMGIAEGVRVKVIQNIFPGPCVVAIGNVRIVLGYGMANRIMVRGV